MSAFSLWSSTLGEQPHHYIGQAHCFIRRETSEDRAKYRKSSLDGNTVGLFCDLFIGYLNKVTIWEYMVWQWMCTWVYVSWKSYWVSLPCVWWFSSDGPGHYSTVEPFLCRQYKNDIHHNRYEHHTTGLDKEVESRFLPSDFSSKWARDRLSTNTTSISKTNWSTKEFSSLRRTIVFG